MLFEFCHEPLADRLEACMGQYPNDLSIKCRNDVSIVCRGARRITVSLLEVSECQRLNVLNVLIINWVDRQLKRQYSLTL